MPIFILLCNTDKKHGCPNAGVQPPDSRTASLLMPQYFPTPLKIRCRASSTELPAAEMRRPGGHLLPDQPRSFPSHVCLPKNQPAQSRPNAVQPKRSLLGEAAIPPGRVPRDVITGVRSGPPCPQPLLKVPPRFIAQAVTILAASEMHKLTLGSRP